MFRLVSPLGGLGIGSRGGGATTFTPSDISGLDLWLQPSNVSQSDNTVIASVTMSVGGDATQATEANKPTWQTNELNGYGVIRYDGGDFLTTALSATQKPVTWFAVVKVTDFLTVRSIVGSSAADGLQWRTNTTTGTQSLLDQGTAAIGTSSTGLTAATWTIIAATYSGVGAFAFYLNGVADGTGTVDRAFASGTLRIGFNSDGTEPYLGDIAEMLRYDSVLATGNLNSVGSHLATKYGLTWTGL